MTLQSRMSTPGQWTCNKETKKIEKMTKNKKEKPLSAVALEIFVFFCKNSVILELF